MIGTFRERRRRIGIAGLAIGLVAVAIPLLSANPASADTTTTHSVLASTSAAAPSIARPGPLTGLVNGQVVTIKVTEAGPTDQISGIKTIRQCEGGVDIPDSASMGPSNTGFCIDHPLSATSDDVKTDIPKALPTDNFVQATFRVGTGSQTVAYDDGAPHTNDITCDAVHSCSLWIEIARTGGSDFVHYDLQFLLGTPTAPLAVAATCTATGANVTWNPPADTGAAPITSYTVTAVPTGGGAAVAPVSSPTTNAALTGFTPFSPYSVTVTATNGGGNTGPASAPPVTVQTCVTAAPVLAAPAATSHQVVLSWTYAGPASPVATGFEVTVTPTNPAGAPLVSNVTPGTATTATVTGLTNGTLYSASVRATYGGGAFSNASNTVTFSPPPDTLIIQTITARRPQGALVLTQKCGAAGTAPKLVTNLATTPPTLGTDDPLFGGYPYPQDPTTGDSIANYPTSCGVAMGAGKLITIPGAGSGQFFEAVAPLNQVTIVDTRDVSTTGWTVNGTMGAFTNQDVVGSSFPGDELGWTPAVTDDSDFVTFSDGSTYDQVATAGGIVAPNQPLGTGLGGGKVLASAPVTARLGIAVLDAALKLWIPITARTGNYVGVLTITAI